MYLEEQNYIIKETRFDYSFMFLEALMLCFMILGEKEFKKPILDEFGQNRTNIENWRRNLDQRVETLVIN